jgi:hypothetical protein
VELRGALPSLRRMQLWRTLMVSGSTRAPHISGRDVHARCSNAQVPPAVLCSDSWIFMFSLMDRHNYASATSCAGGLSLWLRKWYASPLVCDHCSSSTLNREYIFGDPQWPLSASSTETYPDVHAPR